MAQTYELGAAYISILPSTSKLTAGIKSALGDAERQADATGKKMGSSLSSGIGTALKGVSIGAGAALAGIIGFGVKTAASFEQMEISFETLLGTNAKAKKEMAWLTDKAAATPFELKDLAQADKTLLGFGFTSDKVRKQFLMNMGNIAAAVGLPSERLPDLAKIFGQVQASGRVSMEDINQLVDAGIPIWETLTKVTGKSVADLRADMQKGKVSADVMNKAVTYLGGNKFGDAMSKQSKTLLGLWSSLKDAFAIGAMKMVQPFVPMIKSVLPGLSTGMTKAAAAGAKFAGFIKRDVVPPVKTFGNYVKTTILPALSGMGSKGSQFGKTFKAIGGFIKGLLPTVKAFGQSFKDTIGPALSSLGNQISTQFLPAFRKVLPVIAPVAKFILKMLGSSVIGVIQGVIKVISGAIKVITGIFEVLKGAVTGDWSLMWKGIKDILSGAFKAILGAIQVWFNWGILAIFKNGLKSLLKMFKKPIESMKPIFERVMAAISKAAGWLGKQVVPVFKTIARIATKVLGAAIKVVGRVVGTVFKAIGKVIGFVWKNGIKPIFMAWKLYITKVVIPILKFLWTKVVAPVFRGIGTLIKAAWEKVIKPVFTALKDFIIKKVVPAFKSGMAKIGKIWDGLKAAARKPVEFLVNTVYNNGIRNMMNKIPGVDLPAAHFAKGGVLPGYTPGRDVHHFTSPTGGRLALSGGEAIMRPEFTKAVGGKRGVARLNMLARKGQVRDARFANGGVYAPLAGAHWSTYPGHDGIDLNVGSGSADYGMPIHAFRGGHIAYAGSGRGYGNAVFESGPWGTVVYGHMSRFATSTGADVRGGQTIGYVGSTGNSSGPHLHFGFPGGTPAQALALLQGATNIFGGKSEVNPGETKKASFLDAVKAIPDLAKSVWNNIKGMGSKFGPWGEQMKNAGIGALRSAIGYGDKKIPDKISIKHFPDVDLPDNPIKSALSALGIFDNGGVLEPGAIAFNASRKPEAVFNHTQFKQFAESAGSGQAAFPKKVTVQIGAEQFDGYVRDLARDEIDDNHAYSNTVRGMRR